MSANINREDSRRIIEKYANTAKNACKILESAVNAKKMDKTVSKNFINSALSPLMNEVEKYKGLVISETYATEAGTTKGKTHVKQTLSQLEKDLTFLKEEYTGHMSLLESYSDAIGTVQVNRAITAPMLYLTYMGSSGKDKMAYKATNTKIIKNPTKVRYYEIDGETYEAPALFKNKEIMAKVIGSYTRNGLTKVDLTSTDYANGEFTFKKYGTIAADANGVLSYTEGADAIDKELYNYAEIKYFEFKKADGTTVVVEAGRDVTGNKLFMTQANKGRAKVELTNPDTKETGVLHVDFLVEKKAVDIVVSKEVGLVGVIIEIKTGMFNPGLQKPITSFVKLDVIEREINESLVQEFVYNEETKMLWHDIANIDITAESLVGFHEMTVNGKDSYIFADIHETLESLKSMYSAVAGTNVVKSSAPMSGLVDGFVSTVLDFKATTDGTRFYQERQPAKFERLAEMMSYSHLKFQQITQANSIYTNWGTNKSVAMWLTKQEANINTDEVIAGVRPLNTIYHFEQGGNPMKVVVSEREAGWEMGQESVELNGFPVFMDENIENKAFYQFWTFVQDGESKIDYRSMTNPYQKPIMNIDNFGIVSYQAMAASLVLKNIQI